VLKQKNLREELEREKAEVQERLKEYECNLTLRHRQLKKARDRRFQMHHQTNLQPNPAGKYARR